MSPHPREREVYEGAEGLTGPELEAYLVQACDGDPRLRERVERLMAASDQTTQEPSHLLETPVSVVEAIGLREGDVVDGLRILEVLGQGGFGVVYLAQEREPKRKIALKVIKPGMDSKEVLARFEAERQALAIMDHPGIAKVLYAGATDRGLPYFVMEYVAGGPITLEADANQLDTRQRLELMVKVCDAIQHAHSKAVIHRDLKPGNILVVRREDGSLDPKIIDFGVAKAMAQPLTDLTFHSYRGSAIGTPAYMSPEQANASTMEVDTQTDVYALGVILFELLTGSLPFQPPTPGVRKDELDFYERLQASDPPKPSTRLVELDDDTAEQVARSRRIAFDHLQRSLANELDWIPLKAMKRAREERYRSAADFRDDLQRYLDGEPLEARPDSTSYRLRKFVAKRKVPLTIGGAFLLLLVGGLVAVTWLWLDAIDARVDAEAAEAVALELEETARTEMEKAKTAKEEADLKRQEADELRDKAEGLAGQLEKQLKQAQRQSYREALRRIAELAERTQYGGLRQVVDAAGDPSAVEHSERDWEWAWLRSRLDERQPIPSLAVRDSILDAGELVAIDAGTARRLLHDAKRRKWYVVGTDVDGDIEEIADSAFIVDATFDPATGRVVSIWKDGAVREHDVRAGRLEMTRHFRSFRGWRRPKVIDRRERVNRLVEDLRGGRLQVGAGVATATFLVGDGSKVVVWDLAEGREGVEPWTQSFESGRFLDSLVGAGRDDLVSTAHVSRGGMDGILRSSGGDAVVLRHGDDLGIRAIAANPSADGPVVATAAEDGEIRFWDFGKEPVGQASSTLDGIDHLRFSPDGRMLFAADRSQFVLLSVPEGRPLWGGPIAQELTHAGFDARGRGLFGRMKTGAIFVCALDPVEGDPSGSIEGRLHAVYEDGWGLDVDDPRRIAFRWTASAEGDRDRSVLRVVDRSEVVEWEGRGLATPAWRPLPLDGRRHVRSRGMEILWGSGAGVEVDGRSDVLDGVDGARIGRVVGADAGEGRRLAMWRLDGDLQVFDLKTGRAVPGRRAAAFRHGFDLSPDGGWLVHATRPEAEGEVRLSFEPLSGAVGRDSRRDLELPGPLGAWRLASSMDAELVAFATRTGLLKVVRRLDEASEDLEIESPPLEFVSANSGSETFVCEVMFDRSSPEFDETHLLRCIRQIPENGGSGTIVHLDVVTFPPGRMDGAAVPDVTQVRFDETAQGARRGTTGGSAVAIDAALSPSGRRVAVQYSDGTVALFGADDGAAILDLGLVGQPRDLGSVEDPISSLSWDPDGTRIFQRLDGRERIFDCIPASLRWDAERHRATDPRLTRGTVQRYVEALGLEL